MFKNKLDTKNIENIFKSEMDGEYKAQFFYLVTANACAFRIFKIFLSMYNS